MWVGVRGRDLQRGVGGMQVVVSTRFTDRRQGSLNGAWNGAGEGLIHVNNFVSVLAIEAGTLDWTAVNLE